MKTVQLNPIGRSPLIHTNARVLDALLAEQVDVLMACGGKGMCATCHVYIDEGMDALSPRTERETRTLGRLSGCAPNSRLACQSRVLKEGVKVRLPQGLYVTTTAQLTDLIGKRASQRILHPIDGRVLVEEGKIITRSYIMQLSDIDFDVHDALNQTQDR
jgi:ferredoxin